MNWAAKRAIEPPFTLAGDRPRGDLALFVATALTGLAAPCR